MSFIFAALRVLRMARLAYSIVVALALIGVGIFVYKKGASNERAANVAATTAVVQSAAKEATEVRQQAVRSVRAPVHRWVRDPYARQ